MGINFPNTPTVGQLWPQPPVAGQPLYQWDGVKWGSSSAVATTGAVRYDVAQTLTTDAPPSVAVSQRMQARSNIYAAPFDALAYSGMQVNGSMEISQERGANAVGIATSTAYLVDGWQITCTGPTLSGQMVADAPPGYSTSIKLSVTTADAAPAAGDSAQFYTPLEGYRVLRLGFGTAVASPLSIGFWVKANRPGAYSGALRNNNATRSYAFTFSINNSATWEYKTVTIPGDTAGTWPMGNGIGIYLNFSMMMGTTYQTAPGAWAAGNYLGATGTINGVAATTDYMQITGVVVLPGIELPSANRAPFIMRPADQETQTCLRYLQFNRDRMPGFLVLGANTTTPTFIFNHAALVPLRANPTTVSVVGTSLPVECPPWTAGWSISPINTFSYGGHVGLLGGDILVSGTTATLSYPVYTEATVSAAGSIKFDSRL